jgi:signal recognition particle subunit SRP68
VGSDSQWQACSLQLLLFETERAWSYSQELSTQALQDADHAHTLRHSATARFRRAVNWSTELLSHAQALHASGRLSATSLAEATVYTVITNGRFLRHRADYEDALHQLCVARGLLDELSQAASSTRDQALYALFGDDVGPEIRHCAHELGSNRAHDVDGLVKHFGEKHRAELVSGYDALVQGIQAEAARGGADEARRQLDVLMWEDEPVPVRNPELVDVLLRVQRAQAKLRADQGEKGKKPEGASAATSKRGVAAYDAILLALSDAEEVSRKLAEAQKVKKLVDPDDQCAEGITDIRLYRRFRDTRPAVRALIHRVPTTISTCRARPASCHCPRILLAAFQVENRQGKRGRRSVVPSCDQAAGHRSAEPRADADAPAGG